MERATSLVIKSCYSHIGGKFGNIFTQHLLKLGWIETDKTTKDFHITKKGEKEFTKLGMDLTELSKR